MSAFVFLRGRQSSQRAAALRERLSEVDIEFDREMSAPQGTLLFRSNPHMAGGDWLDCEDGFACSTGTFFYRGLFGRDALRAAVQEFEPAAKRLEECEGQFCLLIRKGGQVYLFTDLLGMNKVYHDTGMTVFSSLFLGVAECVRSPEIDPLACYEYAWIGAPQAERTFYAAVRTLEHGRYIAFGDAVAVRALAVPSLREPGIASLSEHELLERHVDRARSLFKLYARHFSNRVNLSMSAGYDSRLLLALLLDAGMVPRLFSYGHVSGVGEASLVSELARSEQLPYECIDKSSGPQVSPEEYAARIKRIFGKFDGWKVDGIFDNLTDAEDRIARVADGRVKMNGSAGEIYRNFFYLRGRRFSAREIVWTFFSRYDPRCCTSLFEVRRYEDAIAATIARDVHAQSGRLERHQVELIYPLVRVRYWTARDVQINQGFGICLFPFLEPRLICGTCDIPIRLKSHGLFEGRMIRGLSPRIASYRSSYGFSMLDDPPLSYRLKAQASYLRPPIVRRHLFRLKQPRAERRPFFLQNEFLSRSMDVQFPYMRRLFHIGRIRSAEVLNRVATIEYHCQRHGARELPAWEMA